MSPRVRWSLSKVRHTSPSLMTNAKSFRFEPAAPRGLGGEHDTVTAPPQNVADPDAVVRRAVGRLGHEQDGQRLRHSSPRQIDSRPSYPAGETTLVAFCVAANLTPS